MPGSHDQVTTGSRIFYAFYKFCSRLPALTALAFSQVPSLQTKMAAEPKAEIHHTYWYEEITLEESLPLWTLLYSCYSCQSDFPVSGPS